MIIPFIFAIFFFQQRPYFTMKFFTKIILFFCFILISMNNQVYSQLESRMLDPESKISNDVPWSLSLSATHMNFAIPKTGNFLSSSVNAGYTMKRTSLSCWTGISIMAENGNLFPYFGVSASQPFLKWSFTNRDSKPFSLSINEALTCFYHPTWDYFLNITLNPSYSFKSFCFTSWIGYANNLEFFKSFMTFGFSVTKTLHNW